jgi:hypothetical protein
MFLKSDTLENVVSNAFFFCCFVFLQKVYMVYAYAYIRLLYVDNIFFVYLNLVCHFIRKLEQWGTTAHLWLQTCYRKKALNVLY